MNRTAAIASAFAALLVSIPAIAAKPAWINVKQADVFEGPSKNAKPLWKLNQGNAVAASNVATQGFYKIRTKTGLVGWVPMESLVFKRPEADTAPLSTPDSGGGSAQKPPDVTQPPADALAPPAADSAAPAAPDSAAPPPPASSDETPVDLNSGGGDSAPAEQ